MIISFNFIYVVILKVNTTLILKVNATGITKIVFTFRIKKMIDIYKKDQYFNLLCDTINDVKFKIY